MKKRFTRFSPGCLVFAVWLGLVPRETMGAEQSPPASETVPDAKISDLAGQWTVIYLNSAVHIYVFDRDGGMRGQNRDPQGNDVLLVGRIVPKDGRLLLLYNYEGQELLERLTLRRDQRLLVEHWNPSAHFPANNPDTAGFGLPVDGRNGHGVGLLDWIMLRKLDEIGCSAASLTVARGNRTFYSRGYGWLGEAHKLPVQPDTPMGIASCDKPFEMAAIQQLAQCGKLDLNVCVFKVMNIKPAAPVVDPRVWTITINHLLEHKAGWQGEPLARANSAYEAAGGKPTPPTPLPDWVDKQLSYLIAYVFNGRGGPDKVDVAKELDDAINQLLSERKIPLR